MAHDELLAEGFTFLLDARDGEPWEAYLQRLEDTRLGRNLPPDRVPATFLAAEVAGALVGRVSIRHALNAYLAEAGGHIGYGVRPAARRRGYATEMLRQALVVAKAVGIDKALVTCDEDNVASAAVIEGCGGSFERVTHAYPDEPPKRRYWIAT
jgi:predicted acetyltransferase